MISFTLLDTVVVYLLVCSGTKETGLIDVEQLKQFTDTLSERDQILVFRTLKDVSGRIRHDALLKVFYAVDANNDGRVSLDEVRQWLDTEPSWRKYAEAERLSMAKIKRQVLKDMQDYSTGGFIFFDEMRRFFANWPLRQVRQFTEDARYLDLLQAFLANPTPELRREISTFLHDEMYADQVCT